MNLTKNERETIVNLNEEEKEMSVYTCKPSYIEKLRKLSRENPTECKIIIDNDYSFEVLIPKSWFKLPRAKRKLSEEELEKRRNNFKNTIGKS